MQRDARLRGLSSEHQHTLVLGRTLTRLLDEGRPVDAAAHLSERLERELLGHFALEETYLLPALEAAGEAALATRTRAEHDALRAAAAAGVGGDAAALAAFATQIIAHVRFEERELYPACERVLSGEQLDEVLRRAPHRG